MVLKRDIGFGILLAYVSLENNSVSARLKGELFLFGQEQQ